MRVDVREAVAGLAHKVEVVVERDRLVETTLEQHGGNTHFARARELFHHLLDCIEVLTGLSGRAVERTERAVRVARVRVIEIGVDDKRDLGLGIVVPAPRHSERASSSSGASRRRYSPSARVMRSRFSTLRLISSSMAPFYHTRSGVATMRSARRSASSSDVVM
jgi:hypothetical protein